MRKLIVGAFVSLDGVMQAPGGPQEDTSGGFKFGGWTFPYGDETTGAAISDLFAQPFALVLGRKTYDIFAGYWPHQKPEPGTLMAQITDTFNAGTKYVATHAPQTLSWQNSTSLGADVAGRVRALKQEDGPVLITQGSSTVVQTLLAADLVDELRLLTYPVILGTGKRLFAESAAPGALKLVKSTVSASGVILATYVRDGAVRTGSY